MSWLNPARWFPSSQPQDQAAPPPTAAADPLHGQAPGRSRGLLAWVREKVGGYPGPTLSAGTRIQARVESEKMARGPRNVVFPNFLPYQDDSAWTGETEAMRLAYRKMLADPICSSALKGLILSVTGRDLQLVPADKKNPRHQRHADFASYCLTTRVAGGWPAVAWSILSGGLVDGYSVCEKVWTLEEHGKWAGKYVLRDVRPRDVNQDLVLQTDAFGNVVGILGLRYNAGEEFSPADFLIFRHQPMYGSPTGLSVFRAAYSSYWLWDTARKFRGIAAERRAIPALIGKAPPSVQQSMMNALAVLKSQSHTVIPPDTEVTILEMAGAADQIFETFCRSLREDIYLAIQLATLQSLTGGEGQQRGNSQVHENSKDQAVRHLAATLEGLLNDCETGLVRDLVDLNFVASEYPRAHLTVTDVQGLTQELQIVSGLKQLGLDLSKDWLLEKFDAKPPENEQDKLPGGQPQPAGGAAPGKPPGGAPPAPPGGDEPPKPPEGGDTPFQEQDLFTGADEPPADPDDHEALLEGAVRQGTTTLGQIAEQAARRLLARPDRGHGAGELFTPQERQYLEQVLGRATTAAHLLGRAKAHGEAETFAEVERFCGGKGSGKPGPCPRHQSKQHIVGRAHANAAQHKYEQLKRQFDRARHPERVHELFYKLQAARKERDTLHQHAKLQEEIAAARGDEPALKGYQGKVRSRARLSDEERKKQRAEILAGSRKKAAAHLPADLPGFAKAVQQAADEAKTGGFGGNKVFINHVFRDLQAKHPGLTEQEFKKRLVEANHQGLLHLSRADLVQAMHPDDVAASKTNHLGSEFNFIQAKPGEREQSRAAEKAQSKQEASQSRAADDLALRRPHQKTQRQYLQEMGADRLSPRQQQTLRDEHKQKVQEALAAEDDVPAEVLRDYPELGKESAPKGGKSKTKVGKPAANDAAPEHQHTAAEIEAMTPARQRGLGAMLGLGHLKGARLKQALLAGAKKEGQPAEKPTSKPAPKPKPEPATSADLGAHVGPLVQHLGKIAEVHSNLIPMTEVRAALAHLPRDVQDKVINEARRQGHVSGSVHEARQGISDEERAAALPEPGNEAPIGYLSLRRR